MNKILMIIILILGTVAIGNCARFGSSDDPFYNISITEQETSDFVDNNNFANDTEYDFNMTEFDASQLSAVLTYSSNTYSEVTFSTLTITMGSGDITFASSHTYATGIDLLLTETSGTVPGPLVDKTTYFTIYVDDLTIQLATTSAQAFAADPIILVSSTPSDNSIYTLTPLNTALAPVFQWLVSNDDVDYAKFATDLSSTPATYTAPNQSISWDFGEFNFKYLRLDVTAPTTGGMDLKVIFNIKD